TVSRALKDSPRISQERRALIQEYAREHNFTPNVIAESLRFARVQPMKVTSHSVLRPPPRNAVVRCWVGQ
ncbi:MAG: LacI family DNA-binding transcriptional regulator, partial [Bacteroidaceae bacterium]|nr:LacI family DNA-binding transcriptional regulator [Bacteroidaceae bacterium]